MHRIAAAQALGVWLQEDLDSSLRSCAGGAEQVLGASARVPSVSEHAVARANDSIMAPEDPSMVRAAAVPSKQPVNVRAAAALRLSLTDLVRALGHSKGLEEAAVALHEWGPSLADAVGRSWSRSRSRSRNVGDGDGDGEDDDGDDGLDIRGTQSQPLPESAEDNDGLDIRGTQSQPLPESAEDNDGLDIRGTQSQPLPESAEDNDGVATDQGVLAWAAAHPGQPEACAVLTVAARATRPRAAAELLAAWAATTEDAR